VISEPGAEVLEALPKGQYVVAVFPDRESMTKFATGRANIFPILKEDFDQANPAGQSVVFRSDDRLWTQAHPELAAKMQEFNKRSQVESTNETTARIEKLIAYKYDTAFGLLCSKVLPSGVGVQGFVLAAILGAIVSSLAAMLNAASTISTMDFFKKYIHPQATQMTIVAVGRVLVVAFMVLGALIAPLLGDPKISSSIFRLIQELQGYISPGILAVFVFGLINRTAPRWSGMIGLTLNPVLYGAMTYFSADRIAFLDRMAISFAIVLATMKLLGALKPMPTPVVFRANTSIELESSRTARVWGTLLVVVTVLLYIVFW
jgi:SSS family solute:Na+ symporter